MSTSLNTSICVLGAGAWGTALVLNLAKNGHQVTLWGRNAQALDCIKSTRENTQYLPGVILPENLSFEPNIHSASKKASILLLVIPSQHMRGIIETIKPSITPNMTLVSCAKGIEQQTGLTMSAVLAKFCPQNKIACLSGPSFAADVAQGLPTAVTIAANTMPVALELCHMLSNKQLRCYASDDLLGVDYGGALKNVLAIAAGIVYGRNLGASAVAAVTARGFAEMQDIALALGAKPETLTGLSGLGDLILTCASEKSRNFAYGVAFARGQDLMSLKLAEGVATAKIAAQIAAKNNIDAPLITAVSAVLEGRQDIDQTIDLLMSRPVRSEARILI